VGPEVEVGNGCIIGSGVHLSVREKLPDNIIITGSQCNRTIAADKPPVRNL
jgi:carbonic anhydrase/acetyltransferase-like protein (isoleucine patch superfamily)